MKVIKDGMTRNHGILPLQQRWKRWFGDLLRGRRLLVRGAGCARGEWKIEQLCDEAADAILIDPWMATAKKNYLQCFHSMEIRFVSIKMRECLCCRV